MRRSAWALLHALVSLLALAWYAATRRGAPLVFRHVQDVDPSGQDAQMGPLLAGLQARGFAVIEVVMVPLGGALLRELQRTRRCFLSHALLLGTARLWSLASRRTRVRARGDVAGWILALVRPRVLFLIDESGSGQALLKAARTRGIRVVGVQHGDFQPDNPQYSRDSAAARAASPADVLGVWSPWFRERLLSISPIYTTANTCVTGRQRLAAPDPPARRPQGILGVLLVSEAHPDFARAVAPYLESLRRHPGIRLRIRPHPGEDGAWPHPELARGTLAQAILDADVVLGMGSSALLEALYHWRPIVVLGAGSRTDPSGYAAAGIAERCDEPEELPRTCLRLAAASAAAIVQEARGRVWGDAPADAVPALIQAGGLPPGETS